MGSSAQTAIQCACEDASKVVPSSTAAKHSSALVRTAWDRYSTSELLCSLSSLLQCTRNISMLGLSLESLGFDFESALVQFYLVVTAD